MSSWSFEQSGDGSNTIAGTQSDGLSLLSLHTNPSVAGERIAQTSSGRSTGDPGSWTYLVNLTATMFPNNGAGSGYKYQQLMNLKDATKDSGSEVIVQSFDANSGLLNRYEIAHGQIHEYKAIKSAGTAQDLQSLLELAPRTGHLALINEGHGNGDLGFTGDAGDLSVSDFEQAVATGLSHTGRTNLDLLSMDSCLMANVQVLNKLNSLAANVVASELEEFSSVTLGEPLVTQYDMQPIDKYLLHVLQNPPKDGAQAAADVLSVSARDCDLLAPAQEACGTPTLTTFNHQSASDAERALDQFGTQLELAVKDAATRKTVDSLIGQLHDVSQVGDHLRDVDTFADGIIKLIDSGAIKDQGADLLQAAQAVLKADSALVKSFYTNPNTKIEKVFGLENKLHGLNTFLPGPDFDVRGEAENIVGPKDAQSLPFNVLLDKEIQRSVPDDSSGGWAKFIRAMRAST